MADETFDATQEPAEQADTQPEPAAEERVESIKAKTTLMDPDNPLPEPQEPAHDTEPVAESREGGIPGPAEEAADALRQAGNLIAEAAAKFGSAASQAVFTGAGVAVLGAEAIHKAVTDPDGAVRSTARKAGDAVGDSIAEGSRRNRFQRVGADLYATGAVTSHGGNLSECDGSSIFITRTNSQLGHLGTYDIVRTDWDESGSDDQCSRELVVHRAIYHALKELADEAGEEFKGAAIVHAHTTHTIFRSLVEDAIVPVESESKYVLGEPVQVFAPEQSIASPEAAAMLAEAVKGGARIAVLRGHGPFAVADDLVSAMRLVSVLEQAAKVADLRDATGLSFK